MRLKDKLKQNVFHLRGWRTPRRLLVIESDDWGSVRMPSLDIYEQLINKGVRLGNYGYEKVDTLASREDLQKLFEICESHRDIKGNPTVITANCVVANPDFKRIIDGGYKQYFYEPITTTLERYYPEASPFELWLQGVNNGVFFPQFHGREHVNVPLWMKSLMVDAGGARLACQNGVFSILVDKSFDSREKNTASFNYKNSEEKVVVLDSIKEGLAIFEQLFGYRSESMIAPSYKWDTEVEKVAAANGIKYLQGVHTHYENGQAKYTFIGRKNEYGQYYLNRNANFEYSQNPNYDWVDDCMKRISIAFSWHKPATISAHRLNFVGALIPNNRDRNLLLFDELLRRIQKQWPDIEFISSAELGKLISQSEQ